MTKKGLKGLCGGGVGGGGGGGGWRFDQRKKENLVAIESTST